jgi:hypothetical protein
MQRTDPVLPPRGRAGITAKESGRRFVGRRGRAVRAAEAAAAMGDERKRWLAAKGKVGNGGGEGFGNGCGFE